MKLPYTQIFLCTAVLHSQDTDTAPTARSLAGLLGMQPDDLRIPNSYALAEQEGLSFTFSTVQIRNAHPNTARLQLTGASGRTLDVVAESIGGRTHPRQLH